MLKITSLLAGTDEKEILHGLSLDVAMGETAAVMGPNGSGKSTLAAVLAGNPGYEVASGSITWKGQDILAMQPEERAAAGIFLAFQYPPSLPGVSVSHFLRLALNAQEKARGEDVSALAPFIKLLRLRMKELELPWEFAERSLGDGFSGGEKKRLEMLQMLVLQPRLVILDEIDSGLDIDAIKVVANAVSLLDKAQTAILVITHYQRLLNHILPDSVHVLKDGVIVRSGDATLAHTLEASGYASL